MAYKSATNGTYQLAVTLNGQPVGTATDVSSPLTLAILSPSTKRPIDVSKTLVSGVGLNGAVAGTAAGFKITTMDANSIPLAQGGVRFQLILNPSSNTTAKLIDNTDGTYQAVYSATVAANYTLTLTVNETIPVPALTAAKVTVVAGASAPEKTTLAGPGFAPSLVAGQSVQAVIVPADAYGNLVTYTSDYPPSKDVFSLRLYDGAGSAVRDVLVSAGTGQIFRPAMLLTASGNYSLQVLLAQKPIASGKAPVTVSPGPISPSMSYVSGANFAGATAGAPRPDGVALLDEFGNQVGAADGATCAVTFTSLAPGVPSVMAACAPARGNFVAAAPLNVSGTYQMTVTAAYGASNVTVTSGVPDTVTVQAGRPSAAQTTVSGIGVTVGGQAGKPASFSIAVKDDWGNEVANPSADGVAVTVTNVATGKATAGTVARADGNILRVTYSVTSSGTFQVAVKVDSVLIASGQNVLVNFTAAASSAANSYARLGGSPSNPQLTPGMVTAITAGQQAKLIVSAVDVFGSPQVDQKGAAKVPDQFVVTFDPPTTADGTSTGAVYSDAISNNDGETNFDSNSFRRQERFVQQ